jgi:ribosomal protein L40E
VTALVWGVLLAAAVVFWILHPVIAGVHAPMERDDEELTEAQHRKRMALYALRDVEYDYHAGKLDERDYRRMKREISSEALAALHDEAREWAVREGRKAAEADRARTGGRAGADRPSEAVEAEIAALRAALREGAVCRECGTPNPPGSRFCGECGSALPVSSPSVSSPPAARASSAEPDGVGGGEGAAGRERSRGTASRDD